MGVLKHDLGCCSLVASFYHWWGAGMVICLERGADLHTTQLVPLPLTVSCFGKIQIGFTFLIPAHLGSPRQRAVKCVCSVSPKIFVQYCKFWANQRCSDICKLLKSVTTLCFETNGLLLGDCCCNFIIRFLGNV